MTVICTYYCYTSTLGYSNDGDLSVVFSLYIKRLIAIGETAAGGETLRYGHYRSTETVNMTKFNLGALEAGNKSLPRFLPRGH